MTAASIHSCRGYYNNIYRGIVGHEMEIMVHWSTGQTFLKVGDLLKSIKTLYPLPRHNLIYNLCLHM